MTAGENERLAKLEVEVVGLREDVGEIKTMVSQLVAAVRANAERGNERHAKLESRIAVLEDRVNLLRYLVVGAGGTGAGSVAWHAMNALGG